MRRRGELNLRHRNREWPHQVAIRADQLPADQYHLVHDMSSAAGSQLGHAGPAANSGSAKTKREIPERPHLLMIDLLAVIGLLAGASFAESGITSLVHKAKPPSSSAWKKLSVMIIFSATGPKS